MLGAGYAGIVCVVLAGWTTANPTLYRAGLAFQVATPNWRRWVVTLCAGVVMIITACIPAVLHQLRSHCGILRAVLYATGGFHFYRLLVVPIPGFGTKLCRAQRAAGQLARRGRLVWLVCDLFHALRQGHYESLAWIEVTVSLFSG